MSDASHFQFAMGDFDASFPIAYQYARNHMWAFKREDASDHVIRFGLTAYAVRLLQDVYFLEWTVDPPTELAHRQMIGSIESKKAESDLFAPLAGTFVRVNANVLEEPSLINAEPYDAGWLFEIATTNDGELLSASEYESHLIEAWEVAQRTIKGQANG